VRTRTIRIRVTVILALSCILLLLFAWLAWRRRMMESKPLESYAVIEFRSVFGRWPTDLQEVESRMRPSSRRAFHQYIKDLDITMVGHCSDSQAVCDIAFTGRFGMFPSLRTTRVGHFAADEASLSYWRNKHWFF
jgi:hypothetical protein